MKKYVKKLQGHSPSQLSMHKFVLVSCETTLRAAHVCLSVFISSFLEMMNKSRDIKEWHILGPTLAQLSQSVRAECGNKNWVEFHQKVIGPIVNLNTPTQTSEINELLYLQLLTGRIGHLTEMHG